MEGNRAGREDRGGLGLALRLAWRLAVTSPGGRNRPSGRRRSWGRSSLAAARRAARWIVGLLVVLWRDCMRGRRRLIVRRSAGDGAGYFLDAWDGPVSSLKWSRVLHSRRSWFPLLENREKWGTPCIACAHEVKNSALAAFVVPTPAQSTRRNGAPLVLLVPTRSKAWLLVAPTG
jgi:hypothetical protein